MTCFIYNTSTHTLPTSSSSTSLHPEPCLGTSSLVTSSWKPCLGTSCWEPLLGNLFLVTLPGNLAWEPLARNLAWEPLPGNPCLGTSSWEPCLGEPLGNLAWEPVPGNLAWEPVPGNLGTLAWGFSWKRRPLPGNLVPNLARCGFGCPPTCSGTFNMAPSLRSWGKNTCNKQIGSRLLTCEYNMIEQKLLFYALWAYH